MLCSLTWFHIFSPRIQNHLTGPAVKLSLPHSVVKWPFKRTPLTSLSTTQRKIKAQADSWNSVPAKLLLSYRESDAAQPGGVCVCVFCLGGPGCVRGVSAFLCECVHLFVLARVCVCQYVCWQHCRTSGRDCSECEETAHLNIDGSHLEALGFGPS